MEERTHTCGELNLNHLDNEVLLIGWCQRFRDHGGKKFIDLRDRDGLTQIVFDPEITDNFDESERIKKEYLISIKGKVRKRPEGTVNHKMKTGEIEVIVNSFKIISKCETLPFEIDEEHFKNVNEDLRLKYRYLDLRRKEMFDALKARSIFYKSLRDVFYEHGFLEIETPFLTKSTPEGARDLLVPSRKHNGSFYALPQSPQLFKQILMVSGVERYFQIAKCFRDEDLRKDRQLEFSQLDFEASFFTDEELFSLVEESLKIAFKKAFDIDLEVPFKRLKYFDAMEKYGSDKPDLRIKGLELVNISDIVKDSNFSVFSSVVKNGGIVKGLNVKNGSNLITRKEIDKLIELVQSEGGKGMAWIKVVDNKLESSITKFFNEEELSNIGKVLNSENGDLLLFIADTYEKANALLDMLRRHLANRLDLIDPNKHIMAWITDFPLFHWNEEEQIIEAEHNPFTMCKDEFVDQIMGLESSLSIEEKKKVLLNIVADCYDLVYNGQEIASGGRRINSPELQEKVFDIIGLSKEEVRNKFGWFVDAYRYSAPSHRGAALGLDRILAIALNKSSIREVIPFPKNKVGYCPLTEAPSKIDENQLRELGIVLKVNKKINN